MSHRLSKNNQIKRGVLFSYFNIGCSIVISLIYTPFLLRMLGQNEYGLFSIAFAAIGILSVLDLGLGNANIRYTAKYRAAGKTKEARLHGMFFLLYLVLGLLIFICSFVAFWQAPVIFGTNMSIEEVSKLQKMILMVGISLAISFPLNTFKFIIRGYERFVFAKFMEFLGIILIPSTAVLLLILGYRSVGVIAAVAVLNVLLNIVNFIYCKRNLSIEIDFSSIDKSLLKEIFGYSVFVFLGVVAFRIDCNANQFILGIISGAIPVALYALAFNFVSNFFTLSSAVSGVFLPVISRIPSDKNQLQAYNGYFVAIGRLQFYVLALFVLGFVFFGRQFILLWAGKDYMMSYWVVLILISIRCFSSIQSVGIVILQALNKHRFSAIVFFTMSLFSILLSVFLSKKFGAIGSAIALSCAWLIGNTIIMNIYYAKKIRLDVVHFWRQIIKIIPAFIPSVLFGGIFVHLYDSESWINLSIGIFLFSIIYGSSIIYFSFNKFEKETVLWPAVHFAESFLKTAFHWKKI